MLLRDCKLNLGKTALVICLMERTCFLFVAGDILKYLPSLWNLMGKMCENHQNICLYHDFPVIFVIVFAQVIDLLFDPDRV